MAFCHYMTVSPCCGGAGGSGAGAAHPVDAGTRRGQECFRSGRDVGLHRPGCLELLSSFAGTRARIGLDLRAPENLVQHLLCRFIPPSSSIEKPKSIPFSIFRPASGKFRRRLLTQSPTLSPTRTCPVHGGLVRRCPQVNRMFKKTTTAARATGQSRAVCRS